MSFMGRCLLVLSLCLSAAARAVDDATLLILGDSLSTGYGMRVEQGWVALLAQRITEKGYPYRVVNASITGDTTRGALARLPPLLAAERPRVTIVELGGNDGLRGLPLPELRTNLGGILAQLRAAGSAVLLLPMQIPPEYGPVYRHGLEQVYRDLATEHGALLGAFILEEIALDPELMQEDRIHPTAAAQPLILERLWPLLEPVLLADLAK
jgi:acyl-CoA thioesterase-1